MLFKIIIISLLVIILISLGTALFSMMKNEPDSNRTVKALTVRIALSIALLILIMIGYSMGLIAPHNL
ncbi:MAG: twin transmembrane helix small protein [Gammaproteobacteria bacterium]|nr:twin transmembrane helix small protein [Gammaproteobacteria bacterium]